MRQAADVDLAGCIRGDKAAWDGFVARFAPVIHAAVLRTFRTHIAGSAPALGCGPGPGSAAAPGDAAGGSHAWQTQIEDAVQDVFVRLIQHDHRLLRAFDPNRAALSTYLTVVARSVAVDRLRQCKAPAQVAALDAAALEAPDPASLPEPASDLGPPRLPPVPPDLLSPRQKLVLTLMFDRGMDVPEIAALLGVDEQTVRSTKHKALRRLRAFLGGEEEGSCG